MIDKTKKKWYIVTSVFYDMECREAYRSGVTYSDEKPECSVSAFVGDYGEFCEAYDEAFETIEEADKHVWECLLSPDEYWASRA